MPGFGSPTLPAAAATRTQSHTNFGFARKAAGVASSSGSYFDHNPVRASRKVGTPLSAEIPAPVSTVTPFAFRNASSSPGEIFAFTTQKVASSSLWSRSFKSETLASLRVRHLPGNSGLLPRKIFTISSKDSTPVDWTRIRQFQPNIRDASRRT